MTDELFFIDSDLRQCFKFYAFDFKPLFATKTIRREIKNEKLLENS